MDKNVSLSIALFLMAAVIATVMSFGSDDNNVGGFGGDYYDRKYQNWLIKRGLGLPSYGAFGRPVNDEDRFFNWRDYLSNGISKRQLNYGPSSFGNFQRYFTNGLQDWKSTYTGMKKREAPKQPQPVA